LLLRGGKTSRSIWRRRVLERQKPARRHWQWGIERQLQWICHCSLASERFVCMLQIKHTN
jgi:hypothetical protein